MRLLLSVFVICILATTTTQGQVGIGTSTPDSSAMLEVQSTNRGFLPPRMTTSERDEILNPGDGLIIFNITTGCLNYFLGGSWYQLCGTGATGLVELLHCESAQYTGIMFAGIEAAGIVEIEVSYNGGNGGPYSELNVGSTGVTGLTATLEAGEFAYGSGTLVFTISGTPNNSGTAIFEFEFAGQNCIFNWDIDTIINQIVYCDPDNPTELVEVLNPATGKIWMDRNLGASQVAQSSNDSDAFGDLYQWGRFKDGHQCRNSSTTPNLSPYDQPGHGDYILTNNAPNDLIDWRIPQNDSLWQGINGVNNPCPAGFRIPTKAELDEERLSWSSQNAEGAISSPLKLPMAGYRGIESGGVFAEGNSGTYMSSTVSGHIIRTLFFHSHQAALDYGHRGNGRSVRCIKD